MAWEKDYITLEDNRIVEAVMPEIISASRSTDIPAFYTDWFFQRLKVGYSAWVNPFNGVKSYISYKQTKFIVFWSKNPKPLLPYLPVLREKNIGCYIQYTLNDYQTEKLETGVPTLKSRIETFKLLSRQLGKEAIIWRFDPMILTDEITIDHLLKKVEYIGTQLHDYTEKLVFSYADIASYKKVKSNLDKNHVQYKEWSEEQMNEFACQLSDLNKRKGWNLKLATCGEKIDMEQYGIQHNRCIDGDLIMRLALRDKIVPENHYFISIHKKDPGQRKFCGCTVAKDIGAYNTCPHLCEYCYANTSKQTALNNWQIHKHNPFTETIIAE